MSIQPVIGADADLAAVGPLAKLRLRGRHLRLVVDEGEPIEIPGPVAEAFAEVVSIMGRGHAVLIVPQNTELTTGEAAELLGVTRPTVVKLMEDGILPFTRPNSSRRAALHDVLAYKQQRSQARRSALDEMTADLVDAGVYDDSAERGRAAYSE